MNKLLKGEKTVAAGAMSAILKKENFNFCVKVSLQLKTFAAPLLFPLFLPFLPCFLYAYHFFSLLKEHFKINDI